MCLGPSITSRPMLGPRPWGVLSLCPFVGSGVSQQQPHLAS